MYSVRCFNVKYSPNLGDGLLSECLERALIKEGAATQTTSVDLAARQSYGEEMAARGTVLAALDMLPPSLRHMAIRAPLALHAHLKWRPHYAHALKHANGVVLGGGNLISDLDLNFPTKLPLAIDEAAKRQLPVSFYACGVANGWSRTGLKWARTSFANPVVRSVFVRDADSKALWDELFAEHTGHEAQVVRDPGLLASIYYPDVQKSPSPRRVAGLNIISQVALRYHADNAPSHEHLTQWYIDLAQALIERGYQVRAFTNGSPEDRAFAAQLAPRLKALAAADTVTVLSQRTPEELCRHIAQFDVLVAFRMHAIIAAYSFGVPAIALRWDRKLTSFMASIDQSARLLDVNTASPDQCATLADKAREEGLPEAMRQRVLAEAQADVARLLAVFTSQRAAA